MMVGDPRSPCWENLAYAPAVLTLNSKTLTPPPAPPTHPPTQATNLISCLHQSYSTVYASKAWFVVADPGSIGRISKIFQVFFQDLSTLTDCFSGESDLRDTYTVKDSSCGSKSTGFWYRCVHTQQLQSKRKKGAKTNIA